jgi:threonine dehydrogenase-like Zn-dependent dehydrogenase
MNDSTGTAKTPSAALMQTAVMAAPRTIALVDSAIPEPGPDEVRVRIEGCGVCASNLAAWQGQPWFTYPLEAGSGGHEAWGTIDRVGRNVVGLKEGDRVAALSYNAYAEYDLTPAAMVIKLPPSLDGKPFPGEPLGCALNVFRRSRIQPGQSVAIVGIGFLGALLTALCSRAGARVIAISRRPFALSVARRFGADSLVPMDDHHQIIETVKELTEGAGCDRVIEAVGKQWPLDLASELTRERGRLIIAGYHQDGPRQVNMQSWNWRGLDVINAHERNPKVYLDGMRAAVDMVVSGALNPSPLYTHTFALGQLADALEAASTRPAGFMKALVKMR